MSEAETTTVSKVDPTVMLAATSVHTIGVTIPVSGEPPTEIRLFKKGPNPSLKGVFLFDDLAAESVMSGYRTMGHLLTIDFDHASLDNKPLDPAKSKISGGLFDVELRNGECWATKIQWSPDAADAIRRKHWPYISPAFRSDEKTGRILLLLNFALTANPALFNAPQITMASVVDFYAYPVVDCDWDPDAAIYRLRKWASSDSSGDTATIDWSKFAMGFAYQSTPAETGPKLQDFLLPHHDVSLDGTLVTSRKGVHEAIEALPLMPIPPADMPAVGAHLASHCAQWGAPAEDAEPQKEETTMNTYKKMAADLMKHSISKASMAKALGMSDDELGLLMQTDDPISPTHQKIYDNMIKGILEKASADETAAKLAFAKNAKLNATGEAAEGLDYVAVNTLSILMTGKKGLDFDATLARAADLNSTELRLLSATGASNVDKAIVVVTGITAFRQELLSLTGEKEVEDAFAEIRKVFQSRTEIAKQAAAARTERVTTMLSVAIKEGRVTPAMVEGKYGLRAQALKDPDGISESLKNYPVIATLSTNYEEGAVVREDETIAIGLSIGGNGKRTTLNGLTYEKLSNSAKASLGHADATAAERKALAALRADWEANGKPAVTLGAN